MKLKKYKLLLQFLTLIFLLGIQNGFAQESPIEIIVEEDYDGSSGEAIETVIEEVQDTSTVSFIKQETLAQTFISPSYSQTAGVFTVESTPNPKKGRANGYVSDPADIISANEEQIINQMLWDLEQKSTAQIAVVMLPSIGNEVPKNFAVDLFEEWGIGQADTDNGLLILTVMDQRRTEFEVGYGLEPILTDAVCLRIGTDEIVPFFKQGRFGSGIVSALTRVNQFLDNPEVIDEIYSHNIGYTQNSHVHGFWWYFIRIYGIISLLFAIGYYGVAWDIERSKDDYYDKYIRLEKMKFGCLLFLIPLPFVLFNSMVKRRLKKYRYAPRYSKLNGKPLFLKNAWAENKFLENGQLVEEKISSVDYDVWVAEDESDILILEYAGKISKYSDCTECGYKTYGRKRSIVLRSATYSNSGKRKVIYTCANCHYTKEEIETIPQKVRSSSSSSSGGSSFSSSSSSSSFGGGSSGGGGSGVSW